MGGDRSLAPAGVPGSTPRDNQSLPGHMRLTVRRVVGIGAAAVVTAIAGLAVLVYFVVSDMCGKRDPVRVRFAGGHQEARRL